MSKSKKSKKDMKKSKNLPYEQNITLTNQELSPEEFSTILEELQLIIQQMRENGIRGALISKNLDEEKHSSPYEILIGCIISLRTKDDVTEKVSEKLFSIARTPAEIANIKEEKLAELIYPSAFYKNKAKQIIDLSNELVTKFNSVVPDDLDELLKFKGVGRKTANLVITLGFGKEGICVDTHVQRITHRIGFIKAKKFDEEKKPIFHNADEVETILRKKLPKKWWLPINDILVTYGQTICVPISPKCSECSINNKCMKVGVFKSR